MEAKNSAFDLLLVILFWFGLKTGEVILREGLANPPGLTVSVTPPQSFFEGTFFCGVFKILVLEGLGSKITEISSLEKSQMKELSVKSEGYILLIEGMLTFSIMLLKESFPFFLSSFLLGFFLMILANSFISLTLLKCTEISSTIF